MKIVIVGAGRVGYAIAEQLLTEGHDITVVESDPERAAYISSTLDVIVVEGRANVDQLRIANVADADLLIAATTSDETNLISCMVGRKLGATHTIARVRDEEYYQDVALLQDELGLSLSINPERTSAKEISRTLRFPAATKVEPFANGLVELVEFKLREGSKLDGLRLNDFRGRYSDGILICAVEREGSVTIPNGDFVLAAGDYVTVVGAPHELHELFRKIGEFRHEAESVIIIGGGRIAERLALELARSGKTVAMVCSGDSGIYGMAAYLMSGNRTATARRPLASPLTDGSPCPHGINDARTQQRSRMGAAGHAPLRNSPATTIRPSICHNRLTLLRPARPCGACATRDKRAKAPPRQVWRMPHRLLSRWHRPTWGRTSARRCGGRA